LNIRIAFNPLSFVLTIFDFLFFISKGKYLVSISPKNGTKNFYECCFSCIILSTDG